MTCLYRLVTLMVCPIRQTPAAWQGVCRIGPEQGPARAAAAPAGAGPAGQDRTRAAAKADQPQQQGAGWRWAASASAYAPQPSERGSRPRLLRR